MMLVNCYLPQPNVSGTAPGGDDHRNNLKVRTSPLLESDTLKNRLLVVVRE